MREILRPRRATRLPGAPAAVMGLVNVRGQIVTVVDLGVALGLRTEPAAGAVMLVEHGPKLVGAAVDEVLEVQRWADDGLDAAPDDVADGRRGARARDARRRRRGRAGHSRSLVARARLTER